MNAKKIKAIRKALGYHPADVRSYVATNENTKTLGLSVVNEEITYGTATIHLSRNNARTAYQMLKKELAPRTIPQIRSAFTIV